MAATRGPDRKPDNAVYDRLGADWWDEDSPLALLRTMVNPVRVELVGRLLAAQPGPQPARILDIGCGGGLLAEPVARLGHEVVGVDLSAPSLLTAARHAAGSGVRISYVRADAHRLPCAGSSYDLVLCGDVLEHVDDPGRLVAETARVLRPSGRLVFDTPNRTWLSRLVTITLAQDWAPTRLVPKHFHVWGRYLRPAELTRLLDRHGLRVRAVMGLWPEHPGSLLVDVRRCRKGSITTGELGRRHPLRLSRRTTAAYVGWAERPDTAPGPGRGQP